MNRVALLGLAQRNRMVGAIEAVGAVGQTVGPWDQRRAVGAVAHRVERIGVEHRPVCDLVLPDPAADLDDHGSLRAVGDLELLA